MKLHRSVILSAVLVGAHALYGAPPASAPAGSAPATKPAFVPNWSTPKDAYITLYHAMAASDGKVMQQSVAWEKPADGELVGQITGISEDVARAREIDDLLLAQFPTDETIKQYVTVTRQAYDAVNDSKMSQMAEAAVASAEVKIDGDTATLTFNDHEPKVVKLKKIDGGWRVLAESVGAPYAPVNDEMRQEMAQSAKISLSMKAAMAEAYAGYVKDLRAKKFATASEAMDAIRKLEQGVMMKVMAEQAPPH